MAAAPHCSLFSSVLRNPLLSYNITQTNFQVISDQGEVSNAFASSESSVSGLIFISLWNEDIYVQHEGRRNTAFLRAVQLVPHALAWSEGIIP